MWGTYDLGVSASLITLGFALVEVDKTNPRKAQFIFQRADHIEDAVRDYWSDRLQLNPRTLLDNLKLLKNRLYSDELCN